MKQSISFPQLKEKKRNEKKIKQEKERNEGRKKETKKENIAFSTLNLFVCGGTR